MWKILRSSAQQLPKRLVSLEQQQIPARSQSSSNAEPNAAGRPFEQMKRISRFSVLRSFMPGGKFYKKNFTDFLLKTKEDYGEIFYWPSMLGRPGMVITYNPQDFERVFRNEGVWPHRFGNEALSYHRTKHRSEYFAGVEGLLASQDEKWGNFRSTVNPVLMQPKNVKLYLQKMAQVTDEFLQRILEIRDPVSQEMPDNFQNEINRWTLESVAVVALDQHLGLLKENHNDPRAMKLFHNINEFFRLGYEVEVQPPVWRYIKTPAFKQIMIALDGLTDVISDYVGEAIKRLNEESAKGMEKPIEQQSVLEKLYKVDPKVAEVMACDMLLAGVDTTTSTFTGLMLCLAKNPEKQEKLREEIRRILPNKDSKFTESSLNNIPYLRACLKESLRHYPLIVGNGRMLQNDAVVGGFQVPKGTQISMISLALNQDEQFYPRAKEYLPERWLRADSSTTENIPSSGDCPHSLKLNTPFAYLPFGFGSRMCIGRRIAEMELELATARLLRNFKVEFNHSTENAFKSYLLNVPNIPLKFKFTDLEN